MKSEITRQDGQLRSLALEVKRHAAWLLLPVGAAWVMEIAGWVSFHFFDQFGIRPRTLAGLWGIGLAPFLHGGLGHLMSNTVSFLVLGGGVLMGGRKVFALASVFILVVGGSMLWLLGPSHTNHIGASLLIFGYLGFLLARGVVQKSFVWVLVSILTLVVYGGMIRGIFPVEKGVSWQGHLAGFFSGILAARVLFTRRKDGSFSLG